MYQKKQDISGDKNIININTRSPDEAKFNYKPLKSRKKSRSCSTAKRARSASTTRRQVSTKKKDKEEEMVKRIQRRMMQEAHEARMARFRNRSAPIWPPQKKFKFKVFLSIFEILEYLGIQSYFHLFNDTKLTRVSDFYHITEQ